jgi:hypothetical protein
MAVDTAGEKYSYPWLPTLLKAHALVDRAVKLSLDREYAATGRRPACTKGCDDCCRHVIPVSAPEIGGALWHLAERGSPRLREKVRQHFAAPRANACPFLVDAACAVYPLRFMACRQFVIFNAPCPGNADVSLTRGGDLLTPDFPLKMQAFAQLATLYGVAPGAALEANFLREFIMAVSAPIQAWDFAKSDMILVTLEKNLLRYQKAP